MGTASTSIFHLDPSGLGRIYYETSAVRGGLACEPISWRIVEAHSVHLAPGPWRNPTYKLKDGTTISIIKYTGKDIPLLERSFMQLDFDYRNNSGKGTFGILQTVAKDTYWPLIVTPYADPINGPKYYDDKYSTYPRRDPSAPKKFNAFTGKMITGSKDLPANEDYVLRHEDVPENPYRVTGRYGILEIQTQIVRRDGDKPVATLYWGYSNNAWGYKLNQLQVTEP
jgi:hypothetical protein